MYKIQNLSLKRGFFLDFRTEGFPDTAISTSFDQVVNSGHCAITSLPLGVFMIASASPILSFISGE